MLARYFRLQGYDVKLQLGVDEHSINVDRKARELGLDTQDYCDQIVERFCIGWLRSVHFPGQ